MIKFSHWFLTQQKLILGTFGTRIRKCNICYSFKEIKPPKKLEYLLILDFEATCDKNKNYVQEIIEFPCLKVNLTNFKEEARFHRYVKPVINPILTDFCVDLTGILQEMVDGEETFPKVFKLFEQWRLDEGLTEENSIYLTSGDWDLGYMMPLQCDHCNLNFPEYMSEWIDIKKLFANFYGTYYDSFVGILKYYNLNFQGRPHSGIDDCLNMFNVVKKLGIVGVEFKATSKLTYRNSKRRVLNISRPYALHRI